MKAALVILSQRDTDALALPGLATVSRLDSWDDGGFALGLEAARRGTLWCDRPYFKGLPDISWLIERCRAITDVGGMCQAGNEQNAPVEQWTWGTDSWRTLWETAVAQYPAGNWLAMPPSPGVAGWQDWVTRDAKHHAVHAYGTFDQMQGIVEWFLANTSGDLYVTECNFGPGPAVVVDRDRWAAEHLAPFLGWCATHPRVKFVAYFAWRWPTPDMPFTTPVDAAGTAIPAVLGHPRPTSSGETTVEIPIVERLTSQHDGRRVKTLGVVIHSTRSGVAGRPLQAEYEATVGYFLAPTTEASAHAVVGPVAVTLMVPDGDAAWHAKELNRTHLGIELAQPTTDTPFMDFQYRATAFLCRQWAVKYGFPLRRVMTQAEAGLIGHEDAEQGKRDGKSDPGPRFDWARLLVLLKNPALDIGAVEREVWGPLFGLKDTAWRLGRQELGDALFAALVADKARLGR